MTKKDGMAPKPIERSFTGLRDALFDEFDQLRANTIKPDRAHASARLAGEITKSVAVQCELLRVVTRDTGGQIGSGIKGLLK